jgi:hypothetical protein
MPSCGLLFKFSQALASFWTTKEVLVRRIAWEQLNSYYRGAMPYPLMKPWLRFLLVAVACVFVGYVTVFVAQRRDLISQGWISSRSPLAQDIREGDRKFLDDLVQKQNQDDHQNGNSAPVQDIGKPGTIDSTPKSVPRAELVINSEIVRRGELVVHSGTAKRKPRSITP